MLVGDGIIAFLLLNEARHRIVAALFGVSREDSNRVTAVALRTLAEGAHGSAARVLAAGALPSVAATVIGAVAVKEQRTKSRRALEFLGARLAGRSRS
jgi:hypothetical protein